MRQIWRTIPQFPFYKASNLGQIKSNGRRVRFTDKSGKRHCGATYDACRSTRFYILD